MVDFPSSAALPADLAKLDANAWQQRFHDNAAGRAIAATILAAAPAGTYGHAVGLMHRAMFAVSDGEFDVADECAARALPALEDEGDLVDLANYRFVMGTLARRRGDAAQALALMSATDWSRAPREHLLSQYQTFTMLAGTLGDLGRLDDSLRHHALSLAIAERTGDPVLEANTLANLGGFHYDVMNLDDARRLCERAVRVAREGGAVIPLLTASINLMLTLDALDLPADAAAIAREVLARDADILPMKRASYHTKFAAVFLHAGDRRAAGDHLAKAVAASPRIEANVEHVWARAEFLNAGGCHAEARALAEDSIHRRFEQDEADLPYDLMRLYNAATTACEALGDAAAALRYQKEAFAQYRELVGQSARARRVSLEIEHAVERTAWQRDEALRARQAAVTEQARLAELNRALESANAAKSRFLAAASHDLRQPVHAVSLFADALASRGLDGGDRELVLRIQQGMRAMNALLSELLDISRLDADQTPVHRAAFPLTELLLGIENEFAASAQARRLELRLAAPDVWVTSDAALLARILRNLVANAINYTERGGVLVAARRRVADDGSRPRVALEVWDTGIGIAERDLPRIFEEFYQVGNAARDRRRGLGLGLAIVRRLADLLGHRIEVRSRPGRGTSVRLWLDEAPVDPDYAPREAVAAIDLAGRTVLLVDDEADVRDAMQSLLGGLGCSVIVADGVESALESIGSGARPDIAILDYRLESGDGIGALRRIREALGVALPALIVTGDSQASDLERFAATGETWLIKPVSAPELTAAIARQLGFSPAGGAPANAPPQ